MARYAREIIVEDGTSIAGYGGLAAVILTGGVAEDHRSRGPGACHHIPVGDLSAQLLFQFFLAEHRIGEIVDQISLHDIATHDLKRPAILVDVVAIDGNLDHPPVFAVAMPFAGADLPTVGEFYPGYAIDIWLGLFAPANTPEPIVTTLRTEVHKLLSRPDFAEKLNVSGSLEPLVGAGRREGDCAPG